MVMDMGCPKNEREYANIGLMLCADCKVVLVVFLFDNLPNAYFLGRFL